jgi:hypothetical protein
MPEFSFTGISKLTLVHEKGMTTSKHVATDFRLDVSPNLKQDLYLDESDLPTKEGVKPLTQAFVQGLVGNIHMAHNKGYWDSAAHLRYIIDELTRGFSTVAHSGEGEITY